MGFSRLDTGVGCHALLQGIFPTQGLNLCVSYVSSVGGQVLYYSTTWEAAKVVKQLLVLELHTLVVYLWIIKYLLAEESFNQKFALPLRHFLNLRITFF